MNPRTRRVVLFRLLESKPWVAILESWPQQIPISVFYLGCNRLRLIFVHSIRLIDNKILYLFL